LAGAKSIKRHPTLTELCRWRDIGCRGMALICASCSPPKIVEEGVRDASTGSGDIMRARISYYMANGELMVIGGLMINYVTISNYKELKQAYEKATERGELSFYFNGIELLTSYAKYLVQYMEMSQRDAK
jgi:hypothetical protein